MITAQDVKYIIDEMNEDQIALFAQCRSRQDCRNVVNGNPDIQDVIEPYTDGIIEREIGLDNLLDNIYQIGSLLYELYESIGRACAEEVGLSVDY